MRAFDWIMVGFIIGAVAMGGTWAFVEHDRRSTPLFTSGPVRVSPPRPSTPAVSHPGDAVDQLQPAPHRRARSPAAPPPARSALPTPPRARHRAPEPLLRSGVPSHDAPVAPEPRAAAELAPAPRRIAVTVGGGVDASLTSDLGGAPQLTLGVLFEPHEHVGLELAYATSRGARLTSSAVEAVARWYPQSRRPLRYHLFAGVGLRRFHAPLRLETAMVPVGGGLTYVRGHWRADTRLTLRLADRTSLHTLGATAHLGWTF